MVGRRTVGEDRALAHLLPLDDAGALVDAGVLVGAAELGQPVHLLAERLVLHGDGVTVDLEDLTLLGRLQQVAGVARRTVFDAGADVGRLGAHQRHGLLLHVGAHQGAVGVVVLEERDQRRADRDDLLRADVHEVDLRRRHVANVGGGAEEALRLQHLAQVVETGGLRRAAHEDALVDERAVGLDRRVGLGDDVVLLLVGRHVDDLAGDLALLDLAVGALDEAELVDPGERGEPADEADVRALRRLDRAHPAVVAEVDVADLEAGALTRQAARTEGRQTAAVGEPGERVHLVHELRQLGGSEELLDGGDDRADVDQRLGRDRLDVLGRHALADDALHARQADAHLVLDQLADRTDAPVGEVVLVVEPIAGLLLDEVEHVGDGGEHLAAAEDVLVLVRVVELVGGQAEQLGQTADLVAQLAVELVAADPGQVVATRSRRRRCGSRPWPTRPSAARPAGPACRSRRVPRPGSGRRRAPCPTGLEGSRSGRRSGRGSRGRPPRRSPARGAG